MFYAFVLVFFLFLVLFVCSLNNEVALLCVCVVCFHFVNKTKWFSCLHLVVLFFCWIVLCPSFVSSFLAFSFLSKKTQKTGHGRNPKKMQTKKENQLAQLCSQIVFLIFWGGLPKCDFL